MSDRFILLVNLQTEASHSAGIVEYTDCRGIKPAP